MDKISSLTDEQLVGCYLEGNNTAFDILLKRYESKVFAYIFYSVKDSEVANDIFQDVFVRVISTLKSGGYEANGKFGAWIMCITRNILVDYFRTKSSQKYTSKDNLKADAILDDVSLVSYENMENNYVDRAVFDRMKDMIDQLPELQREVIVMRYYQEMSFKEIAAVTGVSINTALGRVRYGLQSLRRLMGTAAPTHYAYSA